MLSFLIQIINRINFLGLFQRAIQQSGSATDEWAYTYNPKPYAFELGENVGVSTSDSKILMDDLKSLNSTYILQGHKKMHSEVSIESI